MPTLLQHQSILDWLVSIDAQEPSLPPEQLTGSASKPSRKRRCSDEQNGGVRSHKRHYSSRATDLAKLQTPPFTGSPASSRHPKAGAVNASSPCPEARLDTMSKKKLAAASCNSSSKSKRTRFVGSAKSQLELLEKPVHVRDLESNTLLLPEDAKALYDRIVPAARHHENIIPKEVRQQVEELLGLQEVRPFNFRHTETANAGEIYNALREIQIDAKIANEDDYLEDAWDDCVYSPLLKLVFSPRPPPPGCVGVRMASVVAVPILSAYLPNRPLKDAGQCPNVTATTDIPTSIQPTVLSSAASGFPGSSIISSTETDQESTSTTGCQNSGIGNKKIDCVLCLVDACKTTPLGNFMSNSVLEDGLSKGTIPHVNHINSKALQYSPIACSIEAKIVSANKDPILQLGIWAAAWHRRVKALQIFSRRTRSERSQEANGQEVATVDDRRRDATRELIPSVLLIEVVGHEWRLYFVCDLGSTIAVYGPLTMGSTKQLVEAYTLLASLEIIRDWIITTFRTRLEHYFDLDISDASAES